MSDVNDYRNSFMNIQISALNNMLKPLTSMLENVSFQEAPTSAINSINSSLMEIFKNDSYSKTRLPALNNMHNSLAVILRNNLFGQINSVSFSHIQKAMISICTNDSFEKLQHLAATNMRNALEMLLSQNYAPIFNDYIERIDIETVAKSEDDINDIKEVVRILKNDAENLMNPQNSSFAMLNDKQKLFFGMYIYPFIIAFLFFVLQNIISKPSIINNVTNNVKHYCIEVNNYFTINNGFSAELLNENNLRFVCKEEIIVRANRNNSSRVMAKLPMGKVVKIIDKNEKWVKIEWSDETGEIYSGWIQNWKLSEFK